MTLSTSKSQAESMAWLYCDNEPVMMEVIGPSLYSRIIITTQRSTTQRNATQRMAHAAQGTQRMAIKQDTTHHNSSQPTQSINNIASVPLLAGMMHLPITRSTTSPVPFFCSHKQHSHLPLLNTSLCSSLHLASLTRGLPCTPLYVDLSRGSFWKNECTTTHSPHC